MRGKLARAGGECSGVLPPCLACTDWLRATAVPGAGSCVRCCDRGCARFCAVLSAFRNSAKLRATPFG